jgi:pyridoxine 4-dehydrogenase
LHKQGLMRHLGLSNVTATQVYEARQISNVVCVQNQFNIVHRHDDGLINEMAVSDIAYVPFFPLGGFSPVQSADLSRLAAELGSKPMQVALAWLLHHAPNILLIPGTSSLAHLEENLGAASLVLPSGVVAKLNLIGAKRSVAHLN